MKEKKIEENVVKEKVVNEKALEKKLKRASNDKVIILSIVATTIVIAGVIFGFYFYKTNLKPIVTYTGGKITKAEFKLYFDRYVNTLLQQYGYELADIPKELAQKAVLDEILLKEANDANVTATDKDVKMIEDQFKQKEVIDMFNEQKINIPQMKKMYLNDLKIYAYIQKLATEVKDEDILKYIKDNGGENPNLNEYNTSHILFKTINDKNEKISDEEKVKQKEKAEAVLKRALAGEDFVALVKEFSEDEGTKVKDGKYPMYDNNQTFEEYTKAVKELTPGKVYATLVESQAGYHIIKLDSIVPEGRKNNTIEREYFVQDNLTLKSKDKNIYVNEKEAIKLLETLTGKKIEKTEDKKVEDNTTQK